MSHCSKWNENHYLKYLELHWAENYLPISELIPLWDNLTETMMVSFMKILTKVKKQYINFDFGFLSPNHEKMGLIV